MSLLDNLPRVTFAEKNADVIVKDIIKAYENAVKTTLYPGDPVRLFLETIAYVISFQRNLIDFTGKMNLLAYATDDYLDHLGAFVGVARLKSRPAATTVRFTLSVLQPGGIIIPQGTRVSSGNEPYFAVDATSEIPAGVSYIDIPVTCLSPGTIGNGYISGQINMLVDPIEYIQSIVNLTTSEGGTDIESDDNLRERIQLAPESYSVAGPEGAYVYWTRTANQSITSVAVYSPTPGIVNVYPLLAGGEIPGEEILGQVSSVISADRVRPLTDAVYVYAPTIKEYALNVTYWIDRSMSTAADAIQIAVTAAIADWITWQRAELGRDLNPSELIHRMVSAGAKRVYVSSPDFAVVDYNKIAVPSTQTVTFGGLEDG